MTILYAADIRFPLERANGVHTMETCAALAARGHSVHMLVRPDTVSPSREPLAYYGVPPTARIRIDRAPVFGPPALRRVGYLSRLAQRVLQRRRWDVVYTPELILASAALRWPGPLRPPVVYESHNFRPAFAANLPELVTGLPAAGRFKLARLWRRERRVWRGAEGYVTTTHALASDLKAHFGDRSRAITAPNGVRLDPARRYQPYSRGARPPVVAYAGHFYPYNGAHLLIEALALLPGACGLIIGGHPRDVADGERLRALASARGLTERVTFTGLVPPDEVLPRLREADVLVQPLIDAPYTRYASAMKLFDYMAAGRPIVAFDLASTREVVSDGRTARLVEPGSVEALAAGIHDVLEDPALAGRLAQAAFEEVANYTWERRAQRIEGLLEEVVAGA